MADDDALHLCLLLARADAELRRRLDRVLGGLHGLSLNDATVLWRLAEAPGRRLRRVDLAEHLALTASGVTRLLIPLEKLGFVERQSDDTDGRVAYAALTKQGATLAKHSAATAEEAAAEVLGARFTPAEVAALQRLLVRLVPV